MTDHNAVLTSKIEMLRVYLCNVVTTCGHLSHRDVCNSLERAGLYDGGELGNLLPTLKANGELGTALTEALLKIKDLEKALEAMNRAFGYGSAATLDQQQAACRLAEKMLVKGKP